MPRITKSEAERRLLELKHRAQEQHDTWLQARAKQQELAANRPYVERELAAIDTEQRTQQRTSRDAATRRNILLEEIKRIDPTSKWKPTDTQE